MSETCPKCGAVEDDNFYARYEKLMECGSRLRACQGPKCWEVQYQSDRCRINELEAENERLTEKLSKLEGADDHPEHRCGRCSGRNIVWFAPAPLWNAVVRRADGSDEWPVLCPICFAQLAEERGHVTSAWELITESDLAQRSERI